MLWRAFSSSILPALPACRISWLLALLLCMATPALAQDEPLSPEELDKQSLALRTALHYDPTLEAPLDRLVTLYRQADKMDELFTIYRSHLAQYPNDPSATIVMIRLLSETGEREALKLAEASIQKFPQNSYLLYLHAELLRRNNSPHWIDQLDRAIALETLPQRKVAWIDELLPVAVLRDRRELALKHLDTLAALAQTPEQRLQVARKMSQHQFFQEALDLMEQPTEKPPQPETMVDLELEAATAEVGLEQPEKAAARIDRLLGKLTADYWRRSDILKRRLTLVTSQEERQAMLTQARERVAKFPRDEAAALDLAQMLTGFDLRREALDELITAGERMPQSRPIETQILELFDLLRDEPARAAYLQARLEEFPQRTDLAMNLVKTLFLLERTPEAMTEFEKTLEKLPPETRTAQRLELARFLRRFTITKPAAALFEQVLKAEPNRLDVLRELAETYIALGDDYQARRLLAESLPQEATLENLLDLVQFMIKQEMLFEARTALRNRLDREKTSIELRTVLIAIEAQLGAASSGKALIEETRALADTGARYRLWLESASAFHDELDSLEPFLKQEAERLKAEAVDWSPRFVERTLAFCEVASRNFESRLARELLNQRLAQEPPQEFRVPLRRQLVATLEDSPLSATRDPQAIENQLKILSQEDPAAQDDYKARMAIMHARSNRMDLATPLLDGLNLDRIGDPKLLKDLLTLYPNNSPSPNKQEKVLEIVERLTILSPTDRNNWEEWLTLLVRSGNEARLRQSIRRLLAGIENLPLAEHTRRLLEGHLGDSYWRSIAELLSRREPSACLEALSLIDSVERMARDDQEWLWINWIRAYALNQLGRTEARDAALEELRRMAGKLTVSLEEPDDPATAPPAALRILFPGGLSVSIDQAEKLLTAPPEAPERVEHPPSPFPPLQPKWSFELPQEDLITGVISLGEGKLLVRNHRHHFFCVEEDSGKLIWEMRPEPPLLLPPTQQATVPAEVPLSDGSGRFFTAGLSRVDCYQRETGELLWRVMVKPAVHGSRLGPMSGNLPATFLHLYQGNLLAYDPITLTLLTIEIPTGKVLREIDYGDDLENLQDTPLSWANSGASWRGNRALFYGQSAAVVDLDTGEILWDFTPLEVRTFPILIDEPQEQILNDSPSILSGSLPPPQTTRNTFDPTPASTAAVKWAQSLMSGNAQGVLLDDRLLLMRNLRMEVILLEFPIAGESLTTAGQYLGTYGNICCCLSESRLRMFDLKTGKVRTYYASPLMNEVPWLNAAMNGPLVYLTGDQGLHCINVVSGRRVFQVRWPSTLFSTLPMEPLQKLEPSANLPNPSSSGDGIVPAWQQWQQIRAAEGLSLPQMVHLQGKRIYTAVAPNRLVMLEGQTLDGE